VRPVHRWVVLLGLVACGPAAPTREEPPLPRWVVPPAPSGFPLGAISGRLGRSQTPQPAVDLGLTFGGASRAAAPARGSAVGAPGPAGGIAQVPAPLRLATAWPIPGGGPARAVVYGSEGDRAAIELVEIDLGRVAWRDAAGCAAPVVGATSEAIVCADANGTRAVGIDGKPRWRTRSPFIAFTEDRVAVAGAGETIILDAVTGDEVARVKLPRGVSPDSILASCGDAGRELFAAGGDGRLVRVAEARGGPAISWAVPIGAVVAIHACDRRAILVTEAGIEGASVVAIERATGKITGRIDGVVGAWPARDGSDRVELATAVGVARYAADLTGAPEPLGLPVLGELLASRGDRRLVRATPLTAVLLDAGGVRGYLPFAAMGAVLGDTALLATSWTGSPGETVRRRALPPRWTRHLRVPALRRGVAVDAELRDLPAVLPLAIAGAVAVPDTGMRAVTAPAIDPGDGAALYAIAIDREGERAAVARADLAAKRWRWQRVDGCGPGTPVALAVAREVVVCGTRGAAAGAIAPGARAMVRATSRDGAARLDWPTDNLDAVIAGGDVVVVHDAGRLAVLDAGDGHLRGQLASEDGAAVRVAIVVVDEATLIVSAEHGRVVARLGNGLWPVWSIAVAGVVRALATSGAGVLVALEDGDAYRIDARSAAVVALPGLGLAWYAAGDVVTGETLGGPIPAPAPPIPPPTVAQLLRRPLQILRGEIDTPPPMATPIAVPPPRGTSWQVTLYELTGGLRVRNDYALAMPVEPPAPRGPAGSPLVVAYGPGLREVVVLDPRTGDPLRRVRLPDEVPPGAVFGTVVDGSPVAGALLGSPLRVVLF
jgi:hypothetical protein